MPLVFLLAPMSLLSCPLALGRAAVSDSTWISSGPYRSLAAAEHALSTLALQQRIWD